MNIWIYYKITVSSYDSTKSKEIINAQTMSDIDSIVLKSQYLHNLIKYDELQPI